MPEPQDPSQKNVAHGDLTNIRLASVGDNNRINYLSNEPAIPKELTLSIPRTHPDDLIGREEDLAQLHRSLHEEKRVVVVNGLGGIGKTTLAQAYISKYYAQYKHIAWITQNSSNIANDFTNTAGLTKNLGIDPAETDSVQLFQEIIRRLKTISDKPNLLIIDSAEQSLAEFHDILPGQPCWHLLVTSRETIDGYQPQELGFLHEEQAIALFKKHYHHRRLTDADIEGLVATVDYHTLTIEMLAKTAQVQHYDQATLQAAIHGDIKANIKVPHNKSATTIQRISTYLRTVFTLSRLDEEELWLLMLLACLPAEFHAYEFLKELIVEEKSAYVDVFSETLNRLAQKGWVFQRPETDSYKMHRIVADIIKKERTVSPVDIMVLLRSITKNLMTGLITENPINKFDWIPYGKALLSSCQDDTSIQIASLQNALALQIWEQGDLPTVRSLLEDALKTYQKHLAPDHPRTMTIYFNLALVLKNQGDNEAAKPMLERMVQIHEQDYGPEHPLTAITYSNLATVLGNMHDFSAAIDLLKKAIQIDVKEYGERHVNTAVDYANLATVLSKKGDHFDVKKLMEKALNIYETNMGTDHPVTATGYSNMGVFLSDMANYSEALVYATKALEIRKRMFPEGHPDLILSINIVKFLQTKLS